MQRRPLLGTMAPMFGLSFWEIAMIFLVALVFLGPKRLPGLARTIGKGLRSLRSASSDIRSAIEVPLREVQEPLREIREDLYETVRKFEDDIERGADEEAEGGDHDPFDEQHEPSLLAEHGGDDDLPQDDHDLPEHHEQDHHDRFEEPADSVIDPEDHDTVAEVRADDGQPASAAAPSGAELLATGPDYVVDEGEGAKRERNSGSE